ncbi:malate synthase A [Pseudactinotalea sp. Z1739]|uniref:malate synthase A n=1 Tax=Pseudactinotalea sp. Z1739 TaxID=3413028 RepID=UPI003C7B7833
MSTPTMSPTTQPPPAAHPGANPATPSVQISGPPVPEAGTVLTPGAQDTVAQLHRRFGRRRHTLLKARVARQERIAAGEGLGLLDQTRTVREDPTWQVAPPGPGLARRTVEITGPVSRSMAINALNSGADVWMADLEDATSPTWANLMAAQLNLIRFTTGQLDFTSTAGKAYRVGPNPPTVMMRPRGWHLPEKNLLIDGEHPAAALVDIGLYFHHCAHALIERGQGPYFYLPKLESHLEARLWNEVFCFLQDRYGIPRGTVRATVLVETLPAALEMEEILYELREHSAGLNAGRWDYIFSIIKTLRSRGREAVLPDRAAVTMTTPFMRAYCERMVALCHKRGAHAIGGMSAYLPSRTDRPAALRALQRVRADKARDAEDGFDGGWVAHPGLVDTARDAFGPALRGRDHQLERQREDFLDPGDLLELHTAGSGVTYEGLRSNIAVSLRYLQAWLQGQGAVAIDHLMEDAATVEIARTQVWQWVNQAVRLEEGLDVTTELVERLIGNEAARISREIADEGGGDGSSNRLDEAIELFREVALGEEFEEFFTLRGYARYL